MSSSAFCDRICASSNTMTSTSSKPRPKPNSRAPNSIRDPFVNVISCCPFAVRTDKMRGAIRFRFTMPCNDLNVSSDVRPRFAVHTTLRPGNRMHRATIIDPMVNVLPVWREIDSTTPPMPAAYCPFARFARIARPSPSCHSSKTIPTPAHRSRTAGQPVETIPDGKITCRARSDSFPVLVRRRGATVGLLGFPGVKDGDLAPELVHPSTQGSEIRAADVRVVDRRRDPRPHRHVLIPQRPALHSLGDRHGALRSSLDLAYLDGAEGRPGCRHLAHPLRAGSVSRGSWDTKKGRGDSGAMPGGRPSPQGREPPRVSPRPRDRELSLIHI